MADKLLTTFKQKIEHLTLIPTGGGAFEVKLDEELVYSKLKTKQFPEEKKMIALVEKRLKGKA